MKAHVVESAGIAGAHGVSALDMGEFSFDDAFDQMITEQEALAFVAEEPPLEDGGRERFCHWGRPSCSGFGC